MISFEEAQRRILEACAPLRTETIPLSAAAGRVLAATIVAGADLVPFARSAMDGFALRSADTGPDAVLPIRGRVYAEGAAQLEHVPHSATQIATGAPIPLGADAVVPVENVARENGAIRLGAAIASGSHVFPPGEDARAGDDLVRAGRQLSAADVGLLAAAGHARVTVFGAPRACVLTTGDEVVDPASEPAHGQIRNSNAAVVVATLEEWGCRVMAHAHAPDDREALREALSAALAGCDFLVTTGGASVGERDLVKSLLRELGCVFVFESVALRPAKPTAFGRRREALIAVLPGNPSSAFIALHELARLAALTLAGCASPRLPRVKAVLGGAVHGKAERTYAAYASLRASDDGFVATPLGNQCSALTRTAADAAGFIVAPPGRRDFVPGEVVDFDVVDWSRVGNAT